MQNITSTTELKKAIQLLEIKQAIEGELLKEQFHFFYESLKPINILKSTFKDIATSPSLTDNILGSVMGLATGYLSKKIFVGTSDNMFRKLLGSILQLGVTNVVAKNPDTIKSIGMAIFNSILRKREHLPHDQC